MTWTPTIINPNTVFLNEAYGITEQRRLELCDKMRDMMDGPPKIVPYYIVLNDIAGFVQSKEEFTYCTVVHTIFTVRNGGLR